MDKFTFGNSKAAVNLVKTLGRPEYQKYSAQANRLLAKQLVALGAIMFIPDKNTRETALLLWKQMFIERVNSANIPEVIKTHILCVATSYYRKYMTMSSSRINREKAK